MQRWICLVAPWLCSALISAPVLAVTLTQSFDTWTEQPEWSSSTNSQWVLSNGKVVQSLDGRTHYHSPLLAAWLQDAQTATNSYLQTPWLSRGARSIKFWCRNPAQKVNQNVLQVLRSSDGTHWTPLVTLTNTSESWKAYALDLKVMEPTFLRILKVADSGQNLYLGLDDITIYDRFTYTNALFVNPTSITPQPPYTNWSIAAPSIQEAVDAAWPGSTVVVTGGVYNIGGQLAPGGISLSNRIVVAKPITLEAYDGSAATVIAGEGPQGSNAMRAVYLSAGATLSGFTISNGHTRAQADPTAMDKVGGGIFCEPGTTVQNCKIIRCSAAESAGGVYGGILLNCDIQNNRSFLNGGGAAEATLQNCRINNNLCSVDGGGVFHGTLSNCTVTNNSAGNSGGGGAQSTLNDTYVGYNTAANAGGGLAGGSATQCTLEKNYAATNGGGAVSCTLIATPVLSNLASNNGGGTFACQLTNSRVELNRATGSGGGVFGGSAANVLLSQNQAQKGGGAADATLTGCTVSNNTAGLGGGTAGGTCRKTKILDNQANSFGGGAYQGTLENCLLYMNSATTNGGGSYGSILTHCTVSINSAGKRGGGTFQGTNYNTIIYFNTAATEANYTPGEFYYCCATPTPRSAPGSFALDPKFMDRNKGDFHLMPGSPCVDTASADYASTEDFGGALRPQDGDAINGAAPDVGAFELTILVSDSDGDGLPDSWETAHGLNTQDSTGDNGASGDIDKDGMTNLAEYRADTDPRDPLSLLRVTACQTGANTMQINWKCGAASQVFVERTDALKPRAGGWSTVYTNTPPTPTTGQITVPSPDPANFIRIRAVRP